MKGGGLSKEELSKKFLCFGTNGMNVFEGGKNGVTSKLKQILGPFFHGCALCCTPH